MQTAGYSHMHNVARTLYITRDVGVVGGAVKYSLSLHLTMEIQELIKETLLYTHQGGPVGALHKLQVCTNQQDIRPAHGSL